MAKPFYLSIILSLCIISAVYSELQCYVCVDCPLADASDLKTCGESTSTNGPTTENSTSAPSSNTSDTTTTNNPPIVVNPSTVTDLPAITNTTSVTNSPTVTTASTNSNNTTASPTETTRTASSAVASSNPATVSPAISTLTPVTASSTVTTSTSNTSSPIGSNSSPVTSSKNSNSFTDSPIFIISPSKSNSLNPTVVNTMYEQKDISRKKRFAKEDSSSEKECNCNNGKCDCSYSRLASIHLTDTRAIQYQCYKHKHIVNGTEVIDRGCKEITQGTSETACSVLNVTEGCFYCNTDKCNSAFSLQCSIVLFIFSICLSIVSNIIK